jgi:hypothetical protein
MTCQGNQKKKNIEINLLHKHFFGYFRSIEFLPENKKGGKTKENELI